HQSLCSYDKQERWQIDIHQISFAHFSFFWGMRHCSSLQGNVWKIRNNTLNHTFVSRRAYRHRAMLLVEQQVVQTILADHKRDLGMPWHTAHARESRPRRW